MPAAARAAHSRDPGIARIEEQGRRAAHRLLRVLAESTAAPNALSRIGAGHTARGRIESRRAGNRAAGSRRAGSRRAGSRRAGSRRAGSRRTANRPAALAAAAGFPRPRSALVAHRRAMHRQTADWQAADRNTKRPVRHKDCYWDFHRRSGTLRSCNPPHRSRQRTERQGKWRNATAAWQYLYPCPQPAKISQPDLGQ